jgi:hypothetical protein
MAWAQLFKVMTTAIATLADGSPQAAALDGKARVRLAPDHTDPNRFPIKRYFSANVASVADVLATEAVAPGSANYPAQQLISYTVGVSGSVTTSVAGNVLLGITKSAVATPVVAGAYNLVATNGTTAGTTKLQYNGGVAVDNLNPGAVAILSGGAAGSISVTVCARPLGSKTDIITVVVANNTFYPSKLVWTLENPPADCQHLTIAINGLKEHHYSIDNNAAQVVGQLLDNWAEPAAYPSNTMIQFYLRSANGGACINWVRFDGSEESV